jgi:hypothetical protein
MKTGIELIAEERARQISEEGWTAAHDQGHHRGELIHAAQSYTMQADAQVKYGKTPPCFIPRFWPWERAWWKPAQDPVRNLVKAGALIAAEIDRLQMLQRHTEDKVRWVRHLNRPGTGSVPPAHICEAQIATEPAGNLSANT